LLAADGRFSVVCHCVWLCQSAQVWRTNRGCWSLLTRCLLWGADLDSFPLINLATCHSVLRDQPPASFYFSPFRMGDFFFHRPRDVAHRCKSLIWLEITAADSFWKKIVAAII
jgi:hypothetical protein